MIALSLYKNKKFKLINKKIENKINSNECRLKILYSGICASDIPRAFNSMAYSYPLIMGHEFIGEIIKTGNKVNKFEKGDIVSAFPLIPCAATNKKSYCEYCEESKYNLCSNYDYYGSRRDGSFCEILDVNEWNLFKIEKKSNYKFNSLLEPTAVACNVVESIKKKINNNSKILIIGAGFIGQIICRIIKKKTKKIFISILDRNQFKIDIAKKFSNFQINSTKNFQDSVKEYNSKFDIVIETSGSEQNFLNALEYVKKDGIVIYAGNINNNLIIAKEKVSQILRKQITIKGVWNSSFKNKINNWIEAKKLITDNLDLESLITHNTSLELASTLLEKIYLMKTGKLKNNYLKGIIKI